MKHEWVCDFCLIEVKHNSLIPPPGWLAYKDKAYSSVRPHVDICSSCVDKYIKKIRELRDTP